MSGFYFTARCVECWIIFVQFIAGVAARSPRFPTVTGTLYTSTKVILIECILAKLFLRLENDKKKVTEIVVRNAEEKSKLEKLRDDYKKKYSKVNDDNDTMMTTMMIMMTR